MVQVWAQIRKAFGARLRCAGAWALCALLSGAAFAEEFQIPKLTGPVIDQVGVLDRLTRERLEELSRRMAAKNLAQLQIVVISGLGGLSIEEASIRIVDQYKLGTATADNGLLFLVAPKERKYRIEVGQGLEGLLTDALVRRVLDLKVRPEFQAGRLGLGIYAGSSSLRVILENAAKGSGAIDPTLIDTRPAQRKRGFDSVGTRQMILLFILVVIVIRLTGRKSFARRTFGSPHSWGTSHRSGGFDLFGGGGGSGGSWSGGGGGFSGGGSSGSW